MTINVLLVDDEPSFIELTQEYLRNQEDIVIDGFESVASASDALKKKSYDVIISDYQMPGDSGLDFLRTLRKEGNDIPFVLFTGRGREEVVIEALNLGADSYIQKGGKPTAQFAELSNIIRNLYQQRKAKLDLAYLQVQISTIFESLPGYAFIKDKNGAYVAANRQFLNLTGKTLDELIGKTPYEIFPKEIASKFQTEDDAVLTSGCPLFTEAVFEIDGKKMPVAIRKVPLGDNNNNIVGLIGLAFDISELKDTERALREESQLLNDVFASIQDGLCVLNKDLTVLRENPAMARIYPPFNPPVVGKKCYYAYNNKESRCPDCHAWRAIEKGEVIREHVHRFDPDNAEHWTEIFHFPYYELDSNKIKGVILYLRDITEKKLADKALQEGDRFISLLFSSIQDGISVLDRDLNIVQVNPAMEKWYAHMSPLVGKKCYEAFQGRTEPCKICPSKRCLESGKPQHGIVSMPENAKTGVEYFDLFSFPIKNPETLEIEGVIEYVRDATDRENALNALKREHQQLLAIFESIDESIYVVDPETHEILYVNHAVIEDFGNVIGKKCYKVFQDLDTPCPFCTNDKIFGENIGQPYIWEFENLVLRRWYHCIDRAIIWPDGRLVRCEIAIDVTDRMLSEEQLNQAMKRLDILNKMTRHDMMNKLTTLIGFIEAMSRPESNVASAKNLARMKESAEYIRSQVAFLAEYQQVGLKNPEWLCVDDILSKAVSDLETEGISIDKNLKGLEIYSDPMLEKVFYNLLDNSMRHGKKVDRIKIETVEREDGLSIIYEDNGIGISPEKKARLFKPPLKSSSGFGMYLTEQILSMTQMRISETSEHGKGARFEIFVPPGRYRVKRTDGN